MSKTPSSEDRELSQLLKQLRKTYLDDARDGAKKKKLDKESEADRKFQEQLAKMLGAISDPMASDTPTAEPNDADQKESVEEPAAKDEPTEETTPAEEEEKESVIENPEEPTKTPTLEEAPLPPKARKKATEKSAPKKRASKKACKVSEPVSIPTEPEIEAPVIIQQSIEFPEPAEIPEPAEEIREIPEKKVIMLPKHANKAEPPKAPAKAVHYLPDDLPRDPSFQKETRRAPIEQEKKLQTEAKPTANEPIRIVPRAKAPAPAFGSTSGKSDRIIIRPPVQNESQKEVFVIRPKSESKASPTPVAISNAPIKIGKEKTSDTKSEP